MPLRAARSNQLADSCSGRRHFTGCQVLQGHLRSGTTWQPHAAMRAGRCASLTICLPRASGGRVLSPGGLAPGRGAGFRGWVSPWVVAGWTRPARSCILRHPTSLRNLSSLCVGWRVNPTAAAPGWFSRVQCSPSNHSRIAVRVCAPPGVTPCPALPPVHCPQILKERPRTATPASAGSNRIDCPSTPIRRPGYRSAWRALQPKNG